MGELVGPQNTCRLERFVTFFAFVELQASVAEFAISHLLQISEFLAAVLGTKCVSRTNDDLTRH